MKDSRLADYLGHMREAASQACSFVQNMTKDEFIADQKTQKAVIMNLVILGEAATRVMDDHAEFADSHPEVPWCSMRGMRNRIAHGYFDINLDLVWETVQVALADLLDRLPPPPRY